MYVTRQHIGCLVQPFPSPRGVREVFHRVFKRRVPVHRVREDGRLLVLAPKQRSPVIQDILQPDVVGDIRGLHAIEAASSKSRRKVALLDKGRQVLHFDPRDVYFHTGLLHATREVGKLVSDMNEEAAIDIRRIEIMAFS